MYHTGLFFEVDCNFCLLEIRETTHLQAAKPARTTTKFVIMAIWSAEKAADRVFFIDISILFFRKSYALSIC